MTALAISMRPISVFVIVVAVGIAAVVLMYVRKWRLREEYSLLWLLLAAAMVVLAAFEGITVWIAARLDVQYPPSILFFIALAFVAAMLFHYSLEISRLSDQSRSLAQELSLLRARLEVAEGSAPAKGAPEKLEIARLAEELERLQSKLGKAPRAGEPRSEETLPEGDA